MRLFVLLMLAGSALAGGGPETTLVVVNDASAASKHIASEYVKLRDIPANHVVTLTSVPGKDVITIDEFVEHVWKPIDAHLKATGLAGQIDLIAYSAGFPYAVNFRSRVEGFKNLPKQARMIVGGQASLNGVTYLHEHVLANETFWDLSINRYYRPLTLSGRARNHYFRAEAALRQKRYDIAAQAYQALFRTFPHHAGAWYNCACALARLRKTDDALVALDQAAQRGFANAAHAAKDPDLASLRAHPKFKEILGKMGKATAPAVPVKPTQGFQAGDYILSVHLAHTGRFGNSVAEAVAYLKAAAAADGTKPKGTVYFLKNGNVRSTTREPQWANTSAALKALGRPAELLPGVLPSGKDDVMGVIVGSAGFNWAKSKSTLLPGAIAEHLTSFGAHFGTPGQTKISEFLRHGAAGSSGTVMEPLAIANKFPHGLIHAFYAQGCSLAEAFYQSVAGPYQLMIVGDPLARPFATFQKITCAPPQWRKGRQTLTPKVEGKARFEYWIDGVRRGEGASFAFDPKGVREVRVVAVADDAIATRSYVKFTNGEPVTWSAPAPTSLQVRADRPARGLPGIAGTVDGRSFVAMNIGDRHGGKRLADVAKRGKKIELDGWIELPKGAAFHELQFTGHGRLTLGFGTDLLHADVNGRWTHAFRFDADWWPLLLTWVPKGNSGLEVMLGGGQPLAPPVLHSYVTPMKKAPQVEKKFAAVTDLKRDGKGVAIPGDGLVLSWKRSVKGLSGVVIFPGAGKALPAEWNVEVQIGSRKWKPVKDLDVLAVPPARVPRGKSEMPVFVRMTFAPTRAKKLRLVAKGEAIVAEVELLGQRK